MSGRKQCDWSPSPAHQTAGRGGVGSVYHHGLPRLECLPGERALDRHQEFLLEEALTVWEVESVEAQLVAPPPAMHARHITVHDAPHGCRDGPQHVSQLQIRHDAVGHLEQQLKPVTLMRELLLQGLGFLGVQGVVHRDRHLGRHQLRKGDLSRAIGAALGAGRSPGYRAVDGPCSRARSRRSAARARAAPAWPGESGSPGRGRR